MREGHAPQKGLLVTIHNINRKLGANSKINRTCSQKAIAVPFMRSTPDFINRYPAENRNPACAAILLLTCGRIAPSDKWRQKRAFSLPRAPATVKTAPRAIFDA
jgi:hypothetical protein